MIKWLKNIKGQEIISARQHLKQQCKISQTPAKSPKQLLVDISIISKNDAGTGIQRVVRGLLEELTSAPPPDFLIRTIAGTRTKSYKYIDGGEIIVNSGDIFFGLDLASSAISFNYQQLADWKKQGVTFHFILHDLLPLHHPEWFTKKGAKSFRRWLKAMLKLADNVFCFSKFVAEDFKKICNDLYSVDDLLAHIIPMAWDFSTILHSTGFPADFDLVLSQINQRQTVLLVGTLEPRKGHNQALEAFETLWRVGKDCNLIIVGRPGWKTEKLQTALRSHAECGRRLFWFENASDEALLKLYAACNGVMITSLAEGFGLPLIEALWHGKPVLARDLPVFRERDQQGITYFSASNGHELLCQLAKWLEQIKDGITIPQPANASSWKDTVHVISNYLTPAK